MKGIATTGIALLAIVLTGCTHRVEVAAKEPITINLNVKIEHEIRVKLDKELDDVFSEDSELF
ncbi:YnbE family lipoprotein [Planctobacterium marinum]|uniref:YnbE family lipoprotein n=1 Tax=Planctobacterium marinum TaxID=1631968 RepID=A0AA48I0T3_9ALTE|nr:YnbE family lipoprotein [Planctobacterium marinum]